MATAVGVLLLTSSIQKSPEIHKTRKTFSIPEINPEDKWEEEVDTVYTDDYNITHVKFK